jgi:DNA topoisomerase I
MGYELIISEKPSSALKIAEALADGKAVKKAHGGVAYFELSHNKNDIVVSSGAGHLFGVAETGEKRTYDYPVYDMEWKPNFEVDKEAAFSKKYIDALKKLAKGASSFTIATDYDIEGETIGLNIVRFICKKKDANRMKFSTLTKDDLIEAYENKQKTLDWGQARAGETRHFLDWLYGINLSRALTQSVKAAGSFKILSIGRVQGPSLRLVVEREREIAAFIPVDFWQLELATEKDAKPVIAWHVTDKFWKEDEAKAAHKKAKAAKSANVKSVEASSSKQAPPFPFDLTTLQTESHRCFRIKPKETLEIAQKLYSGGFLSYPRTSSQKLPAKLGYNRILNGLAKQSYYHEHAGELLKKGSLRPNEGKKDDPAHPAIYPTGLAPSGVSERDMKVYDLVVKRFFSTFGEPATRETVTALFDANSEEFVAKGTRTTSPGWHRFYAPYVNLQEEELPKLVVKESLPIKKLTLHKKQTQPPKRFTQSSIIIELEKRNLGTKATRADIVDNLFKRHYVKGDQNIEGTELGMRMLETLEKHSPDIIDEEMTRHFEDELEEIRAGSKTGPEVIEEAKGPLDKVLKRYRKEEKDVGAELIEAHREEQDLQNTLFACPVCKVGTLKIRYSPKNKGKFIGCDKYPDCSFTMPLPKMGFPKAADKNCEHCSAPMLMIVRKGRPPSIECINPNCPERQKMEKAQQKLAKAQGEGETCPNCKQGKMVIKNGRFGMFLGCDRYPECKTIINIPKSKEEEKELEKQKALAAESGEGQKCPKCGEGVLKFRMSARGAFLGCSRYPKCKTIVKIGEKGE